MTVAVTGGTGFIGRHLVAALLREGEDVRMLVRQKKDGSRSVFGHRSPDTHAPGSGTGVEETDNRQPTTDNDVVWGDIRDPAAVERLVRGADLVFHLAAHARAWARDPRLFDTVNVAGTQHVVDAALACGVRRVVHVSTELVHGDPPDRTAYQRSKRQAERIVCDYVARGGDAVIVRPTRVYGPGPLNQANAVTRVIALYRRGLFRVRIADHGARANYVYVADLVQGLRLAAARGARGTAYLIGGDNLSMAELFELVAETAGQRHGVFAVPKVVAKGVAAVSEIGGLLGVEPMITRAWVDVLAQDRPMSSATAGAELGYRPRSAREGIAATVAWLAAGCPTSPPALHQQRQSA